MANRAEPRAEGGQAGRFGKPASGKTGATRQGFGGSHALGGERRSGARPTSDRSSSDRPRADYPRTSQARTDSPRAGRPATARPTHDRQGGEHTHAERPAATRHAKDRRGSEGTHAERPRADQPGTRYPATRPAAPLQLPAGETQDAAPAPITRAPRTAAAPQGAVWLYGQHAVAAALANPLRRLRRLLVTEEAAATLAARLPPPWAIQPETVAHERIDQTLGRDAVHQGVALLADLLPQLTLPEVLERPGPVLLLDQVTDPRNIGAILRSAAAFGAAGVILQERHAPEETGSLAKAASGALETVPLLRAVNLARTIALLKSADRWVVGLDAEAKQALHGPAFAGRRVALVLGGEGEGLRRLTRESCDELAMLPMPGAMESLNVSAACAVALYELGRQG
ncbi:23S rRNA (guanosine(2251)-2'-O)-methyltransferase RlmB [Acidisoma sp. C75]